MISAIDFLPVNLGVNHGIVRQRTDRSEPFVSRGSAAASLYFDAGQQGEALNAPDLASIGVPAHQHKQRCERHQPPEFFVHSPGSLATAESKRILHCVTGGGKKSP